MGRRLAGFLTLAMSCAWAAAVPDTNNFVYQIFVRSFADTPGDRHPKGEIGDLRGIRENLDYLNDGRPGKGKDLEVGILWLMPIFPSGTYHGYDIDDYRCVNPDYGTMQDLRDLVHEAHRRGVRIILDIAFNHTSSKHRWFEEAVRDPNSPFRRYYHLRPANDGTPLARGWHKQGDIAYFGQFSSRMPDLNLAEPAVREDVKSIAKFWLDQGVDGFRLDAAKHVFDDGMGSLSEAEIRNNNAWWREFSDYVYSVKPNALLVGEVLGNPQMLRSHAPGLDGLLDEPFMDLAREYLAAPQRGFLHRWMEASSGYRPWIFLGSHDRTPRLASFLQQRVPKQMEAAYRMAMALLLAIGQNPVLYYGDELMQRGVKWPGSEDGSRIYDETLREPFPWYASKVSPPQTSWFAPRYDQPNDGISVEEQSRPGTMLDTVRQLARLRVQHPEFANSPVGSILTDTEETLSFTRGRYLVSIQRGAPTKAHPLPAEWRKARVVGSISAPGFGFVLRKRR